MQISESTAQRLIDADALMADCQLAQKQADRHGREFANAFYSGGGEISTEWWCVEDMIENAPTIEERKWIPCSDENPKADGRYLITGKMGTVYLLDFEDGRWYGGIKPVAWMLLPKPYAERREEK